MVQPCPHSSHSVHINIGSDSDEHFRVGDMLKGNTILSTDWEARSMVILIIHGNPFHGVSKTDHEQQPT